MVICKYFQQGCCRYGQNCRFEHVYSNKYSYQAPSVNNQNTVTDEQLVKQVQSDIQAALQGGQWILSCFSPYKEKACFPGLRDLSQEEARLIVYEAKANNTLEQAIEYMNNVFKERRFIYEQLLKPSASLIKVLRSIYNGEPVNSPFESNNCGFESQATSLFRSAVQKDPFQNNSTNNQTNALFSQVGNQGTNVFNSAPKSIFAQANQLYGPSQPSNIFQTQQQPQPQENTMAKSIFAQASQNIFGQQQQNIFSMSQTQNVFATNNQPNVFAMNQEQANKPISPQQQNPFKIPPQQHQSGNVFQINNDARSNADIFGISKSTEKQPVDDVNVYSKEEDLSPGDLEAFNSPVFKFGFIPELPPSYNLCV